MLPLLLLAGMLAAGSYGQQKYKDYRDDETASKYRGLLGAGPGPMGPPDEAGNMGQTQGQGLLADPTNIQRQLEFAAGVSGLRGQQAPGLNLLNAAFGRAQQQAEAAQQQQQFGQNFAAGRQDAAAVQNRFDQGQATQAQQWQQQFDAGRGDAAQHAQQWQQQFGAGRDDSARQAMQWEKEFGLHRNADQRAAAEAAQQGNAGPALAKLPAGWQYQAGPGGEPMAAPVPGTTDWTTGVSKAESLQAAQERIGTMLDMLQGKEQMTLAGRKLRINGSGTELYGPKAEQYSVLRGQVISDVAKLRDMGVLQQGEMDALDKQIKDPTSWGAAFSHNSTIAAGYEEMRDLFKKKLEQHFVSSPWLIPPVPKGFAPDKK
jgi:hypothetical protein